MRLDLEMNEPEKLALRELIDKHASDLAEHFDSVLILCTKHGDGSVSDSAGFSTGRGNLYAQIGQAHEWLTIQQQYQRNHATRIDQNE